MATYNVLIEGQTIPVPEEIGANDEAVKQALAPFYPDAANAMITRVEKDGIITVNVVKRAGTKGQDSLDKLRNCLGGRNPAIELYDEINSKSESEPDGLLPPDLVLEMSERISQALTEGWEQHRDMVNARGRLSSARPRSATAVPIGF